MGDAASMHRTAPGQQHWVNTAAVTDTQVESHLIQGITSGQMLIQGNGAYLVEQGFRAHAAQAFTATQAFRPQAVTAYAESGYNRGLANKMIEPSSLHDYEEPDMSLPKFNSLAAILWLRENLQIAPGASIPCSETYNHYLRHCSENGLAYVNEAAFGKFIRLVFVGLGTRRIGRRGSNRYHYCGIGLKSGSLLPINHPSDDSQELCKSLTDLNGILRIENQQEQNINYLASSGHVNSAPQQLPPRKNLDQPISMPVIPEVVFPIGTGLPRDCTLADMTNFRNVYQQHCESFLHAAVNLEFQTAANLLKEFWRSESRNDYECEQGSYLFKTKLNQLCKFGPIQQFVRCVDYLFYQKIIDILIPDVLQSIPSSIKAIRSFARELKTWVRGAMKDCPEEMINIKVSGVTAFAQTLQSYISLNQLAQGARPVLQNSSQTEKMLSDLIRIDFRAIHERVSWACQCDDSILRLEENFKRMLQNQNSLEQWAAWLKSVVTEVLKPHEGKPNFAKAAKEFLLNFSFYNATVVREITLRKVSSFGSLYLIRLLCEEYISFLIVNQVALEAREIPAETTGETHNNNPFQETSSSQDPIMGVPLSQLDLMSLLEDDDF